MTQDEENVPCAIEKKVYSSAFGWNVLRILSLFALIVPFRLMFPYRNRSKQICFDDLSFGRGGVLTCPTIIVLLSISHFVSVVFTLCIEVLLCWVHKYLKLLCLFLGLIP